MSVLCQVCCSILAWGVDYLEGEKQNQNNCNKNSFQITLKYLKEIVCDMIKGNELDVQNIGFVGK